MRLFDDTPIPDRHQQLLGQLNEETESLRSSTGWQRWLNLASRFTEYSLRNQLLILMQRPDATRVAGYKAWQGLGRQVNKGERGIAIFAPLTRSVEEDGERKRVLYGFRVVRVFDVSQTTGEPLPSVTLPEVAGSSESLFGALQAAACAEGLEVVQQETPTDWDGRRGWINHETRTITLINFGQGVDSMTRTLLHELGHWADPSAGLPDAKGGDPVLEVVAESAAWIVGAGLLGLDMIGASSTYVASWLESLESLNSDLMAQLAEHTLRVGRRLEGMVAPHLGVMEGDRRIPIS